MTPTAHLRALLSQRLAFAPTDLLRTLSGKGTPDQHDTARQALVEHLTQGWEDMALAGEIAEPAGHSVWHEEHGEG